MVAAKVSVLPDWLRSQSGLRRNKDRQYVSVGWRANTARIVPIGQEQILAVRTAPGEDQ